MDNIKCLEHVPLNSSINPSFWYKFTQIKLDVDKLGEHEKPIWGSFSNLNSLAPLIEVDSTSFNANFDAPNTQLPVRGVMLNKNTIEAFKECNKNELMVGQAQKLWAKIEDGSCVKDPSLLNTFFVLSFADLKKYHFYYWFAFPTPAGINVPINESQPITAQFKEDMLLRIYDNYNKLELNQKPFFILKNDCTLQTLDEYIKCGNENECTNIYFAFADPSCISGYSGWTVKNYIALLLHHCAYLHGKSVNLLSFRLSRCGSQITPQLSIIFNVTFPDFCGDVKKIIYEKNEGGAWIGWERNERGKLGPRMVNMQTSMDPKCLAETSVDLNLKLMKWRLLPNINLDKIKETKCLLLGSGTLGCSVARVLLGWGVRNINFVDNSNVSFSNPVRQSLFNYEDCVKNKEKSVAAADNLRAIFPGVNSQGYQLSIPMPGHPVGDSLLKTTKDSVEKLTSLIADTDIVFLLMDSRESRWLPTLLGAHYGKVVINAALGFDTYLVMRHGLRTDQTLDVKPLDGFKIVQGNELGCYFCNDVTAPGNSLKDRTLDMQCTVTRPGISQIAGALAVELAISILQHENGGLAPAFYKATKTPFEADMENECILGILPHSIRGFLSTFTHVLPATERYKQCIACSERVLNEYKERGFEFLLEVFNSSKYLEDLTGLSDIYNVDETEIMELSDFEED